jgi:Na+/proline symporter
MSDVGILNSPGATLMIMLILGSPGFAIGLVLGALVWRQHRIWGAGLGAVAGFGLWFLGWLYFTDNL